MLFALVLLPTLVVAKITTSIDISSRQDLLKVSFHGEERSRITPEEAKALDIPDEQVGTRIYFLYFCPNGASVRGQCGRQVYKLRKAVNATVLSIQSKPVVLAHNSLDNSKGIETAQFRADLSQSITNTVTNTWHKSHNVQVGIEVSVEFNILVAKANAKASFSYNHQWGTSGSVSQSVTVGSSAGLTVPVAPGDTFEATLTASRGTCEIELKYETYIYDEVVSPVDPACPLEASEVCVMVVKKPGEQTKMMGVFYDSEIIKVDFFTDVDMVLRGVPGNNITIGLN